MGTFSHRIGVAVRPARYAIQLRPLSAWPFGQYDTGGRLASLFAAGNSLQSLGRFR
jgi:hypothetical protein